MNWTGGRLARHSGAGKNTKQKQHFARVKQNLQSNTQGKPPVKWNILNRVVEEQTGAHWQLRPVPHQSDDGHHSRHQAQQSHSSIPRRSSTRKGSAKHSSRPVGLQEYHEEQIRIKRELIDDREDDIYDATPPPREAKRRREVAKDLEDGDSRQEIEAEERRKRLLRKGDWIGSAALAPPKIVFNSPTGEDKIGKRRRLTDQDRLRFETRRTYLPVATRRKTAHQIPSSNATSNKPLGKTDVRISIGGRVVPPGISSSAKPSKVSRQSPRVQQSRINRASLSSSVMLLDNDRSSSIAAQANARRKADIIQSSPPAAPMSQNIWSRQETHSINEDWNSRSSQRNFISAYIPEQPRPIHFSSRSRFVQCSDIPVATPSPMSTIRIQAMNGQMAYSSSSAQIQHPKPQSSKIFSHFRTNSSDFAESTAAQVGMQQPVLPSSQVLDNDIWQTWMAPLSESSDDVQTKSWGAQSVSISPGISALPGRQERHQNNSSISHDRQSNSASLYNQSDGSGIKSTSPGVSEIMEARQNETTSFYDIGEISDLESAGTVTSEISDGSFEKISEHSCTHLRENSYIHRHKKHDTATAVTGGAEIPAGNTINRNLSGAKVAPAKARDDPDEIWKRFVFGSGGNESESDDNSPKRKTFVVDDEEELCALSMAAQQSNSNQWSSSQLIRHHIGEQISANLTSLSPSIMNYGKFDGRSNLKHQKYNNQVVQTGSTPPDDDDGYSSRAFKGTIAAPSLDSPAVSKHVVAYSPSSSIAPGDGSVRKQNVLFTKPKPFFGSRPAGSDFTYWEKVDGENSGETGSQAKDDRRNDKFC